MPITISGSTGIAGVDGSASTPAVQGTDTNTGIAFPAADTVAIGTGGTERMRVDSSGNVGIGTNAPGAAYRLAVAGNNTGVSIQDTGSVGTWLDFKTGSGVVQGNIYYNFTSGYMTFGTAASGNTQTERARITSGGTLLVGTTTQRNGITLQHSDGATTYRPSNNSAFGVHHFNSDVGGTATLKSYVQCDGTYTNVSDQRFKTDITPARSYLGDLLKIQVVNYKWKDDADNEKKLGVIAQQVEQVFPSMVKNVVGNSQTGETQKMVPHEVFVPMLITAIQELKAENDDLKARLTALEAK
jgi:hypothetical protein